jgi:hypothetical protein
MMEVEMKPSVPRISAAIAVLFLASCMFNKGNFSLINKAKEPIANGSVNICDQTIEFKSIQTNKSASSSYEITCENYYTIQIEFLSGKKLKKEAGYVTSGVNIQDEITVTDSDIKITDRKVN